ncbi:MAG: helix-turn-helix transcriptional regulator [Alphaproteobacteria bacterium]
MTNWTDRTKNLALGGAGLACFALLLGLEVATGDADTTILDLLADALALVLTIGAAVGSALLALRLNAQHEEKLDLVRDLAYARAEGEGWRAKVRSYLAGFKDGIDVQFQAWKMTAAEREVGLLILKGLSHKEIASLRATSEATVRQQAQAIYRKANLPGKTAFSAYFLEDLFAAEPPAALATIPRPTPALGPAVPESK